ncbi:MAG: DUF2950 domain-containing protein [Phycisphaeraceae bacterium]|nr:DUF2950 domain-containing protein [Phycisphaeraceae bacterium]
MLQLVSRRVLPVLACASVGLTALLATSCASNPPQDPVVSQGEAFETPQAAIDAGVGALRADDQAALTRILGVDSKLLGSGDEIADRANIQTFLRKYDESHRLVENEGGSMTLEVGDDRWPMAFPIIHDSDGWRFDTAAGIEEINARRIGRNELDCIQTCRAIADAQSDYLMMDPDGGMPPAYAQKFLSDSGTKNGLFWPSEPGEAQSPLGDLAAQASAEGYRRSADGQPHPYHGYFYRILTEQGRYAPGGQQSYLENGRMTRGFAVIAFPAEYGTSGVMSFMISKQGIVYQRDLGPDTASIARSKKEFNPMPGWTVVN